jgi:hypothetical protein
MRTTETLVVAKKVRGHRSLLIQANSTNVYQPCPAKNHQGSFRVPDTFQLGAILPFCAFLAARKMNNLRVFNGPEHSDSPRLHHTKAFIINMLQNSLLSLRSKQVPIEFSTGGGGNDITST